MRRWFPRLAANWRRTSLKGSAPPMARPAPILLLVTSKSNPAPNANSIQHDQNLGLGRHLSNFRRYAHSHDAKLCDNQIKPLVHHYWWIWADSVLDGEIKRGAVSTSDGGSVAGSPAP